MANQEVAAPAGQFVATEQTMTFMDITLGELIAQMKTVVAEERAKTAAKDETLGLRDREIASLHETLKAKNEKIVELTAELGVARMVAKGPKGGIPVGLERLPNGGVRLGVELDVDTATPYLSQAESAGEDPAVYIKRALEEAILAYSAS